MWIQEDGRENRDKARCRDHTENQCKKVRTTHIFIFILYGNVFIILKAKPLNESITNQFDYVSLNR